MSVIELIEKLSPVGKHTLITLITTISMLLYLHTEFKSNFEKLYTDLDKKFTNVSSSLEKYSYISDRNYKELESQISEIKKSISKLEEHIFFLDRFMARAETHLNYTREKLGEPKIEEFHHRPYKNHQNK